MQFLIFSVALVSQATVALFVAALMTDTSGGVSLDPALVAAYGAISALFGLVTWLAKGRIERCENREDKLLTADADKTLTIRELTTTVAKVGDIAAGVVTAINSNGQRIETLTTNCSTDNKDMRNTIDALSRRIDQFQQNR